MSSASLVLVVAIGLRVSVVRSARCRLEIGIVVKKAGRYTRVIRGTQPFSNSSSDVRAGCQQNGPKAFVAVSKRRALAGGHAGFDRRERSDRSPLNVSWVEPGSDIIECQFGPKYLESYFPVEPAGLASRLLSRMSGAGMNLVSLTFKDPTSCA